MDQQVSLNHSQGKSNSGEEETAGTSVGPASWSDYVHLTKPGITISNLLTAFTGFWLAHAGSQEAFSFALLMYTLAGTALVIMSGAALNNYWDRELDGKMSRTKNRGVASGRIPPRNALILGIGLLILGLAVLYVGTGKLAAAFTALVGHIFYVLIYTPLKRVTSLNTVIGGVSGAVPPVIGWVAVTGQVDMGAWLLFLILFLWQPPHFLALAMLKVDDYREGGLPMLPVVRGFEETKKQILYWTMALVPASLLLVLHANLGYLYLGTATVFGLIYLYKAFKGLSARDDLAWAKEMFGFSLIYLMGFCGAIILSSL